MPHPKELAGKIGGFNEMPPNWEEIKLSHFLWLFEVKPANRTMVYKQVRLDKENPRAKYYAVHMFVFPDYSGIGFITDYNGRATEVEEDAYTCRWFKWKYCDHEWRTIKQRNCYWEGVCVKCGYESVVDSSG